MEITISDLEGEQIFQKVLKEKLMIEWDSFETFCQDKTKDPFFMLDHSTNYPVLLRDYLIHLYPTEETKELKELKSNLFKNGLYNSFIINSDFDFTADNFIEWYKLKFKSDPVETCDLSNYRRINELLEVYRKETNKEDHAI